MLNVVCLQGRLTADPELKKAPSGDSVVSFSIAVPRSYVQKGKERVTDFFDIVAWRNTAEVICMYMKKGSMLVLSGELQRRDYRGKDGTNKYKYEIICRDVHFADRKLNEGDKESDVFSNMPF